MAYHLLGVHTKVINHNLSRHDNRVQLNLWKIAAVSRMRILEVPEVPVAALLATLGCVTSRRNTLPNIVPKNC